MSDVVGPLGLPAATTACLFDLDGVLTRTAQLHRMAWKQTFDALLGERVGTGFNEFTDDDYVAYVDGRPRDEGARAFLEARGVSLPKGASEDPPGTATVHAVGNQKDELFLRLIGERGVEVFPDSVRYVEAVNGAGLAIGVVTSSANGERVLDSVALSQFVSVRVDGRTIGRRQLRGKPAPDSFIAAADELGATPKEVAVFEDALSGVQAGVAGGFGHIVGVDRVGMAQELRDAGAHVVVSQLTELLEAG